eukprot:m.725165 g.725165  ORF g.725165 m.725165 type:complete len:50 (+) comp23026_c1_seq1:253-402(+)
MVNFPKKHWSEDITGARPGVTGDLCPQVTVSTLSVRGVVPRPMHTNIYG